MTPTDLVTYIRQRHNAVGDTFWSDQEILNLVWEACFQMAREAYAIEGTTTTATVAGTQTYAYPTSTIAIKRITWMGIKLQPISFREDDQLTGLNAATLVQGNPQYYALWNSYIYLRPIPSDVQTLQIFTYKEPVQITTSSTLEIPTQFHLDTVDYAVAIMNAKEKNFAAAQYWQARWDQKLARIKAWGRKRLRTDSFSAVQDMNSMNESFLGTI